MPCQRFVSLRHAPGTVLSRCAQVLSQPKSQRQSAATNVVTRRGAARRGCCEITLAEYRLTARAARRAFSTLQDGWAATYVPSKNASFIPRTKASETWFSVVAATDAEELRLLPHLLKHYAWIPPSRFVVVLHAPKRTATYREMAHHVEAFGVMGHVHWASPYSGAHKEKVRRFAFARLLQSKQMKFGDWVVHADSDEFVVFDGRSFEEVLARASSSKADVVGGAWTDRVADQGVLAPIPDQDLWEAFPLNCAFRRKPKVVAYKLPRLVTDGAHAPLGDGVFAKDRAIVYHFKWHSHVLERLKERIEVKRRPRQFGGRGKQGRRIWWRPCAII